MIGILALQGGYAAHAEKLSQLGIRWRYIRQAAELDQVQGLILPGGESPTMLKLAEINGLFDAILHFHKANKALFGTCAGAILLAKEVYPKQKNLGLMDFHIERNAYGRQLASRIVYGKSILKSSPLEMIFIRAPRFKALSASHKIIARYGNEPVCVQQGRCLAATFHPELTTDLSLHQYFVELCSEI